MTCWGGGPLRVFWGAAPGAGLPTAGGCPPPLPGPASWACAESAANDRAETKGTTIFIRLDALIVWPTPSWRCRGPHAVDDSPRAVDAGILADLFRQRCQLQMSRITAIFRPRTAEPPAANLARRLDHIAIGPPRHHAVLQLAGGRQVVGKPQADTEDHRGNDQSGDGAAAVVA